MTEKRHTNKEHAAMLRKFSKTLFGEDGKIMICPMVRDEKKVWEHVQETGSLTVGGKKVAFEHHQGGIQILKATPAFHLKPKSITENLIQKLNDLNEVGFDIFFAINPMTCNQRCQKAVKKGLHILLESDSEESTPEEQFEILKRYRNDIVSVTYSGNKSVHAIIRLTKPLKTPYGLFYPKLKELDKDQRKFHWEAYRTIGAHWIQKTENEGLIIDPVPAVDCSRVSRLPGFINLKTGKTSELWDLNPEASFDPTGLVPHHSFVFNNALYSTDGWSVFSDDSYTEDSYSSDHSSIKESHKYIIDNKLQNIHSSDKSYKVSDNDIHSFSDKDHVIITNSDSKSLENTSVNIDEREEEEITVLTNVVHFQENHIPNVTFLDHLNEYENLKLKGIPQRHTRRSLHPALYVSSLCLGMGIDEMKSEWSKILSINPDNIDTTINEGVEDMVRGFNLWKGNENGCYLPNCTTLANLEKDRLKGLKKSLKKTDCPNPHAVCKIIYKLIWDNIRTLPWQNLKGTIGLYSGDLRRASVNYRKALDWMISERWVTVTDNSYSNFPNNIQTRLYRINTPLILHFLDFKTEELEWERAPSYGALLESVAT